MRVKRSVSIALLCSFALVACNQSEPDTGAREIIAQVEPRNSHGSEVENSFGFYEAMERGPNLFGENAPRARLQTATVSSRDETASDVSPSSAETSSEQMIAYSYGYGFQIDSDKITELQSQHVALCEGMGPQCRVLRTSQASSDSWDGYGEIRLEVAASQASGFVDQLTRPAESLGGQLVSSVRDGEDLSDSIIDSEARLQSRLILREKLTAILSRNTGSVAELIAAEKAVADVNEQIDATRARLEEYRSRIRYSDVRIEYEPYFGETQLGFGRPVLTAFKSIGSTLGMTVAALIYLITTLVPIILLVVSLRWVLHRFGLRMRFWKKT